MARCSVGSVSRNLTVSCESNGMLSQRARCYGICQAGRLVSLVSRRSCSDFGLARVIHARRLGENGPSQLVGGEAGRVNNSADGRFNGFRKTSSPRHAKGRLSRPHTAIRAGRFWSPAQVDCPIQAGKRARPIYKTIVALRLRSACAPSARRFQILSHR